ncbi:MAG: hypothetical protein DSZ11_02445 [Sulfurovum sp.]|nr:MAG: hypothetical protein DSZ11_02445 [Sulfurovum sp.]
MREDILYMLSVNLASELSAITYFQKLRFWTLKKRYQKIILSVIEDARSYILQNLNRFISNSSKERRALDAILWSINQNITHLLVLPKHNKTINVEEIMDRIITKVENQISWNNAMLIALLKYNKSTKELKILEPSYLGLVQEISDIKRVKSNTINNEKAQIERYIEMVEHEINKMQQSKEEQEKLEQEIKELTLFIEDIDAWVRDD